MNKEGFVVTKCKKTAESLIQKGMTLISYAEDMWFFINDDKFTFSNNENVSYTNTLFY